MEARRQAKIYSRPRTPLETVIPLETPYSVEIDICSKCNFACSFCFHSDARQVKESGIKFGLMEMPLFEKIIADLKRFPTPIKKIRLFEFGEPLLNRHLPDMIRHIWSQGVADYVEITTNGTLLNEALNLKLIEAGISRINISMNALAEEKYRRVSQYPVDLNRLRAMLKHLYDNRKQCHLYIKLADDGSLTREEEDRFYADYGTLCDEIFVERLSPIWRDTEVNSQLGEQVGPYGQKMEYKKVCPLIFTRMVINSDGVVVACCVDWKRNYIIGDISRENAYDIWNGERLQALQLRHLRGEREEIALCRGCNALMSCTIDNVDAHAGELAGKLETKMRGES